MLKLLAKYEETRHVNEARKVVAHLDKHPMSACTADPALLREAIDLVNTHAANDAELTEVRLP